MLGLNVITSPHVDDGTILMLAGDVVIGTRPRTPLELARWDARWIVQNGLRDVLEWLGEKPIPKVPPTGKAVLDKLTAGAVTRISLGA